MQDEPPRQYGRSPRPRTKLLTGTDVAASRQLKVFRTAIGFHDAYVAAPSMKAALRAWGAERNLFATGAAEQVGEGAIVAEARARPGEVIRKRRGSLDENLAALAPDKPVSPKAKSKPAKTRNPPRPGRNALDDAEAALAAAERERDDELDEIAKAETALRKRRQAAETRHDTAIRAKARQRDAAAKRFDAAMSRWRDAV